MEQKPYGLRLFEDDRRKFQELSRKLGVKNSILFAEILKFYLENSEVRFKFRLKDKGDS